MQDQQLAALVLFSACKHQHGQWVVWNYAAAVCTGVHQSALFTWAGLSTCLPTTLQDCAGVANKMFSPLAQHGIAIAHWLEDTYLCSFAVASTYVRLLQCV